MIFVIARPPQSFSVLRDNSAIRRYLARYVGRLLEFSHVNKYCATIGGKMRPITEDFARKVMPPDDRDQVVIFDSATPNFGLRITRTGHRAWISQRRIGKRGRMIRFTLGAVGEMSVLEARRMALDVTGRCVRGEDPAVIRAAIAQAHLISD